MENKNNFTPRELDIIEYMSQGLNNAEIAKKLFISIHTVKSHLESMYEKIASMSCKAAVKGNQTLSYTEASALIEQLMKLENPFHCPHGRPVTIELSKYEIEKKFKRIV